VKASRILRLILVAERRGAYRLAYDGHGPFPSTHVREGESLRYAAARLARSLSIEIRTVDISAVAETEGIKLNDRTIDIYFHATVTNALESGEWVPAERLEESGVPHEVVAALKRANGAPYVGKVRVLETRAHRV
jgi:hypothetical protein